MDSSETSTVEKKPRRTRRIVVLVLLSSVALFGLSVAVARWQSGDSAAGAHATETGCELVTNHCLQLVERDGSLFAVPYHRYHAIIKGHPERYYHHTADVSFMNNATFEIRVDEDGSMTLTDGLVEYTWTGAAFESLR